MTGKKILQWLIIFFFVVGIIRTLRFSPSTILVPLLVFGSIYYFLKNPDLLRRISNKFTGRNNYYRSKKRPSSHKFEVIDGKKKNDDDRPKYH